MLNFNDFRSGSERLEKDETRIREELVKNKLYFGISFLDEAFKGILPTDLVLIGAASGVGKTELVSNIAYKNASRGKKVFGIFLEAFEGEIELRQKYRLLAKEAKKAGNSPDYAEWINGEQPWLDEYTDRVDFSCFNNVYTKYRTREYTVEHLEKDLLAINDQADLIVIDHLHYFDITDENENRGMTRIVKTISDIVQVIRRPVVLVAHLRKRDQFSDLVPNSEDFMGSSNISKIATKIVTMATLGGGAIQTKTLVRIPKFRINGSVAQYVAQMLYSTEYNDYMSKYLIGKVVRERGGQVFQEIDESKARMPKWYKGGL